MIEKLRNEILKQKYISRAAFSGSESLPEDMRQALTEEMNSASATAERKEECRRLVETDISRMWEMPTDFSGHVFEECFFSDMDVSRWDLYDCCFISCVFRNVIMPRNMEVATFEKCLFERMSLSEPEERHRLEKLSATECGFCDCQLQEVDSFQCFFDRCSFKDCSMTRWRNHRKSGFTECGFENTDLSSSVLNFMFFNSLTRTTNLNFSGSSMHSCELNGLAISGETRINFQGCDLTCASLQNCVVEAPLEGAVLDRTVFTASTFSNVSFRRQMMDNIWLNRCSLGNCLFEGCRMSSVKLCDSELSRVSFRGCQAAGAYADGVRTKDVLFEKCNLDYMVLDHARLENTIFQDCSMVMASRHDLGARNCSTDGCNLSNVKETDPALLRAENFY